MTVALHATVEGPDAAPALVLLNSLGASTAMWDAQVGALAEDFRVIRIDARGHGRSPAAPGHLTTMADLGHDVLAVLDRLEVARAHLAGVSLGGMTALWLAAHHPDRVGRLAVLCSSAHPGRPEAWQERAAAVRAAGMDSIADPVVQRWLTPDFAARNPEARAALRDGLTGCHPESYAQCCEVLSTLDLRHDLARIATATLVVAGAQDEALPAAHSRIIEAGIVRSRWAILDPAAHIAPVERAGSVTALLLEHFGAGATLAAGYATRRAVLGDPHVDAAVARTTGFSAAFQDFITRYAWGDAWSRPGLPRRDRSLITLAALVTLGAEHEIAMHVRAAITNGVTPEELGELLLHTALYAGLPRANRAFAIAQQVLAERGGPDGPDPDGAPSDAED
jgi:3-oxoadipate enol-lactonase/4-carboxymuconolactone decarboxylase